MTRLLAQIGLLFWKHQILIRRRKLQTICEFLIPAILLLLIVYGLSFAEKESKNKLYEFQTVSLNGSSADLYSEQRFISAPHYVWDCGNKTTMTLAYSYESASKHHSKAIIDRLKLWYNGSRVKFETRHFDQRETMKEALMNDLNLTYESCHEYIGGVHFSKILTFHQTAELNYAILLPRISKKKSWDMKHIGQFWRQADRDESGDHNDIPSDPPYWSSGFLSLQCAIEKAFIGLSKNDSLENVELRLHRLPIPPSEIIILASELMLKISVLPLIVFANYMLKDITLERDSGIMAYMSVMGLNQFAFYGSHFLIALAKMLPFTATLSAVYVYKEYIKYTDPFLFASLFIFFGALLLILALFFGILFKKFTQIGPLFVMGILWQLPFEADLNNVPLCLLASLNPFSAFSLAMNVIAHSEKKMLGIGWSPSSLFANASSQFTVGMAFLMFLFDFLLFSSLAIYVALVMPTNAFQRHHPLFFLKFCGFQKFLVNQSKLDERTEQADSAIFQNENIEPDCLKDEADIVVNKMCKKWPSTARNQFSVDRLSFKAFRGQITVLLGRNGAGKSTTFSVLTGMVDYNAGQVLICGIDPKKQLRHCQNTIGFCPQYNPLFDRLTVKEHLEFYAGTKSGRLNGPNGRKALDQEICTVTNELGIETLLDMQARKLSGGQKRKLCVAIALIGNSRVVLLDEPSAGMDPEARRELGQMLKNIKHNRTILLTTHYMEEADTLGDRIVIIVNGRLVCNGSPQFLKNRFGTGYALTMVVNTERESPQHCSDSTQKYFDDAIASICAVIRRHSPDAYIENQRNLPEFTVILPLKDKKYFAGLFKELEQLKGDRQPIKSFGLSLNSLEQVFLKVNELEDQIVHADSADLVDGSTKLAQDLFGLRQQQFLKSSFALMQLWVQQIRAMLCRHFLWLLRNPFSSFGCFAGALLAFLIPIGLFHNSKPYNTVSRSLSPSAISEYISVLLQFNEGNTRFRKSFVELAKKIPYANSVMIPPSDRAALIDHLFDVYPMVIGASEYQNGSTTIVEALFSGVAFHSPPMALSFVTNALLGKNSFAIVPEIELYDIVDKNFDQLLSSTVEKLFIALLMGVIFTFMSCFLLKSLVDERSSHFKHQLLLTRLHPITYWASFSLWHLIIYSLFCLSISTAIFVFGLLEGAVRLWLLLLWFLFFWLHHPWLCCASFFFKKPQSVTTAFVVIILLNTVVVPLFVIIENDNKKLFNFLNFICCMLIPAYGFTFGVFKLTFAKEMFDQATRIGFASDITFEELHNTTIFMLISGSFYWILLFFLQSNRFVRKWNQLTCRIFYREIYQKIQSREFVSSVEDEDVRKEQEFVEHNEEQFILCVSELTKFYGKVAAVDGITFGVQREDCFGLLGVNGAGKTTTFDILSGIKFASSGYATISGIDVSKHPPIGFCPQFDALPTELTGREVLTLVAHLNGFSDVSGKVQNILECIQMGDGQADKQIRYNSGGQRRRISLGVTLLSRSNFILLDEPTAGIDPSTRRDVWRLIRAIRHQHIAILLTSHSMDECEALCNRIAFMNKGKLIGIGSSQHLKSRYGLNYILTISISNPDDRVYKHLQECVCLLFEGASIVEVTSGNVYQWEIPKRDNVNWSDLYQSAQGLADKYPVDVNLPPGSDYPRIIDFSLTQNSLEQVFLHLSSLLGESTPIVATPKKSSIIGKAWKESKV